MKSRKLRPGILVGIVLTFLVLLMPNVAADTHYVPIGSLTTTASDGDPTADADVDDKPVDVDILGTDTVVINVNWYCSDTSGLGSIGSQHNFTLDVNKSVGGDRYRHDEVGLLLAPPDYASDSGQLSVTYENVSPGIYFWVNVTCKVLDKDSSKFTSDEDSCTITTY